MLSGVTGIQIRVGVVRHVQLYFGLLAWANGNTGGSIRYHVSRTRHASCATDNAQ